MQDLNDLYLFSAVVTHGGFSAAARALDIPKSRLSKRVASLEEELGVRLIERSTRTMRVTDVGQAFFEKCEAVLSGADEAQALVAEALSEPRGVVRVSCPPALTQTILARVLPKFSACYPLVRVLVSARNRPVDLIDERIDVALRARSNLETEPDMMMRTLGRGQDILVASPSFIAQQGPITVMALSKMPTLSPRDETGRATWRLLGPDDQTVDVPIEIRIACNDFEVIRRAACAGLGVALLPQFVCGASLKSGALTRVLPEWGAPEVTIHLVFTTRRGLPPAVRAFIDHLVEDSRNATATWPDSQVDL
ncbi:MAG: LysR family transcriptional regulator [Phycisphaerales bacterium]|nr:LysR family transcriptional regulator [Hyphomonadaceae bacterium]